MAAPTARASWTFKIMTDSIAPGWSDGRLGTMLARVIGGNTADKRSDDSAEDGADHIAAAQHDAEQRAAHRRSDFGMRVSLSPTS